MRFKLRRSELSQALFTWTGVLPAGAFLVLHLVRLGLGVPRVPLARWAAAPLGLAELCLVWLPLAIHAVYGFGILLGRASPPVCSSLRARWNRTLLRASGAISFCAIVLHAAHVRWPVLRGRWLRSEVGTRMIDELASTTAQGIPLVSVLYLFGSAALVVHFAMGSFVALAERRVPNHLSTQKLRAMSITCGVVLFALAAASVLRLATGSALPWPLPAADFRP